MPSPQDDSATTLGIDGGAPPGRPRGLSLRVVGEGIFATFPLPESGVVVIGRSSTAEIRIDDASISRQHAALHLGTSIVIEDLGGVNGTKVGEKKLAAGEKVTIATGEVVDLGTVMVIVQPRAAGARPRRIWPHGYFEARLEEECARAERNGTSFAVVRLRLDGPPVERIEETLAGAMRPIDSLAVYGPGEYEALLPEVAPDDAEPLVRALGAPLRTHGVKVAWGIACYPRDGRAPETLLARANDALRGDRATGSASSPGAVAAASSAAPDSDAMRRLLRLVDRIATGTISVLLLGETGVGKEVLAETVHRRSPRAAKPYLKLNCAALAENLLESELFGHEKGSFTGAIAAKPGLLETAQGGTVFLDEVGELPMTLQVKLLRVLEERKVTRVGALKPRDIDVRFVSATNRDLEGEIARGNFRQDLYFRLNGMTLMIPPLRDRVAEIEGLAATFIGIATKQAGRTEAPRLGADALDLMKRYAWPGNIRELRNVVERAVLLCEDVITTEHLPVEKMVSTMRSSYASTPTPAPVGAMRPATALADPIGAGASASASLKGDVEALERQRIIETLDRFAGNQTQAAKALGISRGTLLARLEQFGLPRPRKK